MAKIRFSGALGLGLKSLYHLVRLAAITYPRHLLGKRLVYGWSAKLETAVRFWRHQLTAATSVPDREQGRLLFDSLMTSTNDVYEVEIETSEHPKGNWCKPQKIRLQNTTLLYFHGGGYTYHGAVHKRFAAMLAHHSGAVVFAPDYRLAPENSYPAQAEDALEAWQFLTRTISPENIIVIGDSAGGHMALTLLKTLEGQGFEQPALCVGLSLWVDIRPRGDSYFENEKYDLLQSDIVLQFREWLDPESHFDRESISPIYRDFSGLAPVYLQLGGRELFHDMVVKFTELQKAKGVRISLDVWGDMPHVFQAFDSLANSSQEALNKLASVIQNHSS